MVIVALWGSGAISTPVRYGLKFENADVSLSFLSLFFFAIIGDLNPGGLSLMLMTLQAH